jgi:hypothetical protein
MGLPTEITSQDVISGNLLEILQEVITTCHSLADSKSVSIELPETIGPVDISNENLVRIMNQILTALEAIETAMEE